MYIASNVYINNDFVNTPTAAYQNNGVLYLTGNFINNQPAMIEGTGTTRFNGSSLQQIDGTEPPVFHNVNFENSAGVELNINTTIGGTISTVTGSLYFNGHALTMGGSISTAYTNTRAFNVTPASDLVITGNAAAGNNLYFDPSANTMHDLTVSTGANAVLGNALNITGGNAFGTVTVDGNFDATGLLTIKSAAGGDARVGESGGTIINGVTVERFIPAKRAWRFLGIPFSSSIQSINQAWQEGYTNTNLDCPSQYPGTPGFGTQITYNGINGYDLNTTTLPSIKIWQNNAWAALNSTITPKITDDDAYCLFVRGDRTICLIEATSAIPNNTVLRATGTLNQVGGTNTTRKDFTGSAGEFFFLGNPFASAVDLTNVINGGRVNGFDPDKIWVWDPLLTSIYGVGAYVTYSNGIWVPSGGSYPGGTSNLPLIQSGQAFMVQTNNANASVTFLETDKTASQANVFGRQSGRPVAVIYTNLMQEDSTTLLDGVAAGFAYRFAADLNADDALKQWNEGENIALIRNEKPLAIEFRPIPFLADTLFFRLYLRQQPYAIKIFADNLPVNLPAQAWLVDKYLGTETPVNLFDTTVYSFTPVADTNSYRNRFMLVFNRIHSESVQPAKTARDSVSAYIYPNPVTGRNFNLVLQHLEKGDYTINIYTKTGALAATHFINYEPAKGIYVVSVPSGLTSGNYLVQIVGSNGKPVNSIPVLISR